MTEEVAIQDPCRHFKPVTSHLNLTGFYVKDSEGRKLDVVAFCRPGDPEGWAYYLGANGEVYPINQYKGYRRQRLCKV